MNPTAISHRGRPLDCFPLDEKRMCIRLRTARGDFSGVTLVYADNKFVWHERRSEQPMRLLASDSLFDYYTAELSLQDDRLAYIFRLEGADGPLYFCEEGVSSSFRWDFGFFNYFQYPGIFPGDVHTVPAWMRGAVCYQIFPERFAVGSHPLDKSYVNLEWGAVPNPKSFAGGDLWGVTEHLDYLQELGVTCLYLTPVFLSDSNHKYDIHDYYRVDPRFGGDEALHALIDAAHARDMRVLLDGVFNHCSSRNFLFTDVCEKGRASPYYHWFFIDGERPDPQKGNYRTFASVPYMPKLNTENDAVIDWFCDVGRYWLREFGADGWRLDVSDEISMRFLRRFRDTVKAEKADAVIIGEVWHNGEAWLRGDQYDSIMNYGLTKACLDLLMFRDLTAAQFADRLTRLLWRNTAPVNDMMLNLLDSHDTERFLMRVDGDKRRLRLAMAILFFFPGMPMLFAGDEVGVSGGYDPDCRRCFPWDAAGQDRPLHDFVQSLARLRRTDALSRGDFRAEAVGGALRITRTFGARRAVLTLNPTDAALTLPGGETLAPFALTITQHDDP